MKKRFASTEYDIDLKNKMDRIKKEFPNDPLFEKLTPEKYNNHYRLRSFKFNSNHLEKMSNYLIYIFWKFINDNKRKYALYVGCSTIGLERTFSKNHEFIKHINLKEVNEIEIIYCDHVEETRFLELKFIHWLQPEYNKIGKNKDPLIINIRDEFNEELNYKARIIKK